ncbi:DUF4062 domain-containing protein [Algibacter lectus]|uniref:Uncharacterized protein DUF4062 n=1 Tax=Algibacter lectus TaxID=221126 RepID=A0A4R8MGP0_9FLAO|nr:DUF4062 domain-containing protein [Algibacter lectus]MWW23144.1 DUF4062 domain-containing protein [Algibacter lectus]TDY64178.1 uncharacterized protein DUF4062 [Algibacter lectus]
MSVKRNNIKVFVASTVYNFQSNLDRIYNLLDGFGYDVFMSHKGTIPLDSSKSCATMCTDGVEICDVFLGFIRPDYGSGVLEKGGDSITHMEFKTAVKRNIPRFVLCDYRVTFTRNLFKDSYVIENYTQKKINFENIAFQNKVMDTRCITMYNEAVKDKDRPASRRTGNWVQEYYDYDAVKMHIESQFKYPERIQKLIDNSKA